MGVLLSIICSRIKGRMENLARTTSNRLTVGYLSLSEWVFICMYMRINGWQMGGIDGDRLTGQVAFGIREHAGYIAGIGGTAGMVVWRYGRWCGRVSSGYTKTLFAHSILLFLRFVLLGTPFRRFPPVRFAVSSCVPVYLSAVVYVCT